MSERATPSPRLSPLPGHGTPARNSLRTAVSGLSAFHPSIRAVLTGMLAGWAGFVIALGNFEGTFYRYMKAIELQKGSEWQAPASMEGGRGAQ